MHTIVFLDRATIEARFRAPDFTHAWIDHDSTAAGLAGERLAGATIAITNKVPLGPNELDAAPNLKLIVSAATGFDSIDIAACKERGVHVSNIRGYAVQSVAEHTFALLLALRHNMPGYAADLRNGVWRRDGRFALHHRPIHELRGSTLGLVGYGAAGRAVERLAEAFGMRVLVAERRGVNPVRTGRWAFEDVLGQSDVVSMHAPLTPETRRLIGAAELALMKPGAILLNTSRGGLLDEQALAAALASGHIGGAGLDVLSQEPPPLDHPLASLDLPNLIITPHQAWASREAMQSLADQLVDVLEAFAAGKDMNRIV